jgi:hypothetical protein
MKRDNFTLPLAFPGELIIDNFAGGGGTSTGLEAAFGRPVDIAINHRRCTVALAHGLRYTSPVSSNKGLIGFGIPCNRCDASRRLCTADRAASLFVPPVMAARMGGLAARRFAQAVPGIPTRSSCRPRLESGAAVVAKRTAWRPHMAHSLASPGTATLAASELIIEIIPRWITRFRGTSAQLIAEGLIPEGFKWPSRTRSEDWSVGNYTYSVQRCRVPGTKGPQSVWVEGDFWVLDYDLIKVSYNYRDYVVHEKMAEIAEIIFRGTNAWGRQFHVAYNAKKDEKYMAFRQQLGITEPRKPGRPRKDRSSTQVGASHG